MRLGRGLWMRTHGPVAAEGKQTRYELRDFVLWTQRDQLCGPLHVPFRRRGQPDPFLTEEHRLS